MKQSSQKILKPNRNCWKITEIDKLSLLFDSCEYFDAFFDLLPKAERSIVLAGWEMEPKLGLRHVKKKYPDNLRSYFLKLVKEKPKLNIWLSAWKPALYLKFGREFFAKSKWRRLRSKRIHYSQKKAPFVFGSCHEKVAVIDETVAFIGGIDVTKRRWDKRSHKIKEKNRYDHDGYDYCPTHDMHAAIAGEAADLAMTWISERSGAPKPNPELKPQTRKDFWPATAPPQITRIKGALARTEPQKNIKEIEAFYLDAINSAENYIYIENQYFSRPAIVKALEKKLLQEKGPEIIIVLPLSYPGFFERAVFGHARNKYLKSLILSDKLDRLRLLYPSREGETEKNYIIVHSKFMAVDNRLLTVGSANLNNRSMEVDTELNLCIESENDKRINTFIRSAVVEAVSEHLGAKQKDFSAQWTESSSLIQVLAKLKADPGKGLKPLPLTPLVIWEKIFLFISPFVDVRFLWPKHRFNLTILLITSLFLAAAGATL